MFEPSTSGAAAKHLAVAVSAGVPFAFMDVL
jgi:hypothetical protein